MIEASTTRRLWLTSVPAMALLALRGLAWWLSGSAAAMAGLLSAASLGAEGRVRRWTEHSESTLLAGPSRLLGLLRWLAAGLVALYSLLTLSKGPLGEPSLLAAGGLLMAALVAAIMLPWCRHRARSQGLTSATAAAAGYRRELLWTPALLVSLWLAPSQPWLDSATALVMALYLGRLGWQEWIAAARARVGHEVGSVPLGALYRLARSHPEVVAVRTLELQERPGSTVLELSLLLDWQITAERAESVAEELVQSLHQQVPGLEVLLRMAAAPMPTRLEPLRP